ncbi:MAG TPA: hypothetical protein VJS64_16010 [Pyrinomonadaceae bacterium]|nr:hypothetical protein [Pyrinomonadaceae bacterium]
MSPKENGPAIADGAEVFGQVRVIEWRWQKGTEIVAYGRSLGLGGAFYAGEIKPEIKPA